VPRRVMKARPHSADTASRRAALRLVQIQAGILTRRALMFLALFDHLSNEMIQKPARGETGDVIESSGLLE
jgi:hypothetical protein